MMGTEATTCLHGVKLNRVCAQCRAWMKAGSPPLKMEGWHVEKLGPNGPEVWVRDSK